MCCDDEEFMGHIVDVEQKKTCPEVGDTITQHQTVERMFTVPERKESSEMASIVASLVLPDELCCQCDGC